MIDTTTTNPTPTQTHTRYPAYKDSGVDWLGEIPAHWEVKRIKFLFNIGRGRVISQQELIEDGLYPVFSSQTKDDGVLGYINTYDFDYEQITWTTDGANAGTVFLRSGKHNCTNVCGTLKSKDNKSLTNYVFYALQSVTQFYKRPDTNGAKIMNGEMAEIQVILPPLAEQTRITKFLDQKTAQIDQAIAQKERLIQLLNEQRQVMIHRAVTRGLNPDAPMKDSGVDWIGEIPAHWEVSRINWLFSEKDETGYPNLPLLIVSINSGVTVRDMDDNENRKQLAEDFNVYKRTLAGDIAFNKMRMWQGAVGVVPQDGLVSPDYVVARPGNIVNSAYYGYLFKTREYLAEFVKHSHGIAWDRNRLYWEDFKTIFAIVPPLDEQNQIVDFLNTQQREIAFATKMVQTQIQKLQELKSTLINSAVTGKIKV